MKFKLLNGRLKDFDIHSTRIDWTENSLSVFQKTCKDFFYPYWKHDIVCEEFRIFRRMSLDIFNVSKRIVVEVQGRQHSIYVPFLSGSRSGYLGQIKRDMDKVKWCEMNQLTLIEIFPENMPLTKEWIESAYDITL